MVLLAVATGEAAQRDLQTLEVIRLVGLVPA
jgi:hypothetical protein